jgi:hypothetical protein
MRLPASLLACIPASLIWIAPAAGQTLNLTRSAKSGVDSTIAQERAWDRNCNATAVTVTITKNPANGTISVASGVTSTIPPSTPAQGSTGACAGKSVTGNEVKYKSNAGFTGIDSVSYTVSNQPQRPRVITIEVK